MSVDMAEVTKADCMTLDALVETLGVSKQMMYQYINALNIRRIKFPFDRRGYIALSDVERVKEFVKSNRH